MFCVYGKSGIVFYRNRRRECGLSGDMYTLCGGDHSLSLYPAVTHSRLAKVTVITRSGIPRRNKLFQATSTNLVISLQ